MVLEYTQMLSTVLRKYGYDYPLLMKSTHEHHPCTIWAGEAKENYYYLLNLAIFLFLEYTYRYGKIHARQETINFISNITPQFSNIYSTRKPLCMPEQYKVQDIYWSYREYYRKEKMGFAKWTKRDIPFFISRNI